MDPYAFLNRRRLATEEELAEGRKQMEEADRRMRAEGLEVIEPRNGRPGGDGQFLGSAGDLSVPAGRPESYAPAPGQTVEAAVAEAKEDERRLLPEVPEKEMREAAVGGGGDSRSPEPPGLGTSLIPLFDQEQLRRFEELQRGAPLLLQREQERLRPGWMRSKEERVQGRTREEEDERRREVWRKIQALEAENKERRRQNDEIMRMNEDLRKENRAMREKIKSFLLPDEAPEVMKSVPEEVKIYTPEDEKRKKSEEGWKRSEEKSEESEVWATPRRSGSSKDDKES
eukprot:symbB.v1.2.038417.t1/scaffold5971.1/size22037/2